MFWILFLLAVLYNGYVFSNAFLPATYKKVLFASSFITGSVISVSLIALVLFLSKNLPLALIIGDPSKRIVERETVLTGKSKKEISNILKFNKVKYIIIYKNDFAKNELPANIKFLNNNFKRVFQNGEGIIYKI